MSGQNKRHVHADLIIAWANGAEIEYRRIVRRGTPDKWDDAKQPAWDEHTAYRIKAEPKPDFVKYDFIRNHGECFENKREATQYCHRNGGDLVFPIKVVFNGDTGLPISVELVDQPKWTAN